MDRILFVASEYPYPPHHGSAVHAWSLLLSLKQLGFAVDLIATVRNRPSQQHIDAARAIVDELFVVERTRTISAALGLDPFQVRSRRALLSIALSKTYEVVVLKSDYVTPILDNPSLTAKVRVLIADGEARYFRELSKLASSWKERLFYRSEAFKFDRFCPRTRPKCDLLWFVSDWERVLHLQKHPEDTCKAVFLPPDPGGGRMCSYSGDGNEVLFVGSLTFPPNLEGLEWYLEDIHPRLSKIATYTLTVAGRTDGASIPILSKMARRYSNISLCFDPQELRDLYKKAAVFVNPVLRGAGIKLKTINALQAGVPVVSTSIGMEGTGLVDGKHLLVADSPDSFVRGVTTLLRDRSVAKTLVESAQSFLAETYDCKRNIVRSLSALPVSSRNSETRVGKEEATASAHS